MRLETRFFQRNGGWSSELPTGLDSDDTFVVCFGGAAFCETPSALLGIRAAFPRSRVLGCSTAGEIYKDAVHDDTLVVAIARMEHTGVRTASTHIGPGAQSFRAGQELARRLAAPDLRAIFLLSDGLQVNGSELVRGVS
ncbi:MAG: FIST N-terminal domain-containing protein, partial [Polyangiaceae bacterium]